MKRCVATLIVLSIAGMSRAQTVTLTFKTEVQEYKLTFDPSIISESEVRRLAIFSPYTDEELLGEPPPFLTARSNIGGVLDKVFFAPHIEFYTDSHASGFYARAQARLKKGNQQLALLNSMKYPKELGPVVNYLKEPLSFSLWIERTKFEYYKSWHTNLLGRKWRNFDPSAACSEVLRRIEKAPSRENKSKLVGHDWNNCVLTGVQAGRGTYPVCAWNTFLTTYGIKEENKGLSPD